MMAMSVTEAEALIVLVLVLGALAMLAFSWVVVRQLGRSWPPPFWRRGGPS